MIDKRDKEERDTKVSQTPQTKVCILNVEKVFPRYIRYILGKLQFQTEKLLFLYNFRELILTGQVRKSVGRMTWHQEPTKDVTSCDKLRLGANIRSPTDFRMRERTRCNGRVSYTEYIGIEKVTRGTETSKYP